MEKAITLTPLGKKKASDITDRGEAAAVVAALQEHGTSTFKELSDLTGMGNNRIKKVARELYKSGYIKVVEGTEE